MNSLEKTGKKYKVRHLKDAEYQVVEIDEYWQTEKNVHSGNLVECEAWIRLTEVDIFKN